MCDFNPRSHEGSDFSGFHMQLTLINISIRAPTRGATQALLCKPCCHHISIRAPTRGATPGNSGLRRRIYGFQSALPRGERPIPDFFANSINVFQSALPRGERPRSVMRVIPLCDFNPRSHEGSDKSGRVTSYRESNISIRAPTRGATKYQSIMVHVIEISIRAPTRGATRVGGIVGNVDIFQSALPRGERRNLTLRLCLLCNFNPRSHEGSDICCVCAAI